MFQLYIHGQIKSNQFLKNFLARYINKEIFRVFTVKLDFISVSPASSPSSGH